MADQIKHIASLALPENHFVLRENPALYLPDDLLEQIALDSLKQPIVGEAFKHLRPGPAGSRLRLGQSGMTRSQRHEGAEQKLPKLISRQRPERHVLRKEETLQLTRLFR